MTVRYADEAWRRDAACVGHPHAEWWDGKREGESLNDRTVRHQSAALVCRTCPVVDNCWADEGDASYGVRAGRWAGWRIKLPEPPSPPTPLRPCGTASAYARHIRHGEKPCEACRVANAALKKAQREAKRKEAS